MPKYNFPKAKQLIEKYGDTVAEASLGIHEDWLWTAETVFEDGQFTQDLDTIETIGGISGSSWGTPTLHLEFTDGTEKFIPCHDETPSEESGPPISLAMLHGALSGPVQANIKPLETEDEE